MVDAICLDEKRVLPCTAFLEGEYGVDGLYFGVPVKLGAGGVEEIVKLKLSTEEKKAARAPRACGVVASTVVGALAQSLVVNLGLGGRTAIVCGASSGIGLAIAGALIGEGANVAMFARRRDLLEREAERLGALPVRGDLTNPKHLEALVDQTRDGLRRARHLVLNGGGPPPARRRRCSPSRSRPRSSSCSFRTSASSA